MKQILSLYGGAVTLTETDGVFSLNLNGHVGGGEAAKLLSGQASLQLDADAGLKLGESLLISHLPAALQPEAKIVGDLTIKALEALE